MNAQGRHDEATVPLGNLEQSPGILQVFGHPQHPAHAAAVASPYLRLFGTVAGGWLLAHSALVARHRLDTGDGDRAFLEAKIKTARFYADNLLPHSAALAQSVVRGADSTLALDEAQF